MYLYIVRTVKVLGRQENHWTSGRGPGLGTSRSLSSFGGLVGFAEEGWADCLEDWGTPALLARCPPRLCVGLLVFTLGGSSLGLFLSDLSPPRPARDFILGIEGAKTGFGDEGGESGSTLTGF